MLAFALPHEKRKIKSEKEKSYFINIGGVKFHHLIKNVKNKILQSLFRFM